MNISMDKKYKTRSGKDVVLYAIYAEQDYCIHGAYLSLEGWEAVSWIEGGLFDKCNPSGCLDLIEVKPTQFINVYWDKDLKEIMKGVSRPSLSESLETKAKDSHLLLHYIRTIEIDLDNNLIGVHDHGL